MTATIVLVAVGVVSLLVLLLGLRWLLRGMAAAGKARAFALAGSPPLLVEPTANCFGFESKGATQLRGNGCLALTPDRLVFAMWVPARDTVVERSQILRVDTAKSHLGKTQGAALLRVRFRTPQGVEEVAAWRLRDLTPWLEELRGVHSPA